MTWPIVDHKLLARSLVFFNRRPILILAPGPLLIYQQTRHDHFRGRPRKVLETRAGIINWRGPNEPSWVTHVCENLTQQE